MIGKTKLLAGVFAAAALAAGSGYYWLYRRPLPKMKGRLRVSGLATPVEIIRDRWGTPHIYAQHERDALFAQGYVHAQERLFQMDFNRRLAAGRLAEVLGAQAFPVDRWLRILGLRRVAEEQAELLPPTTRELIDSYSQGVNAYLAQGNLPLEFSLLRYTPEPWKAADTLAWGKMMAWYLSVNWETEILRARLVERLGAEKAAELEPLDSTGFPNVVPAGVDYSCIGSQALRSAQEAEDFIGPSAGDGLGSNNWVIGPQRSATGLPLLANDMHLALSVPAIWIENHLVGGELNATGVSFPGIPGVMAGHNSHIAWGFTNGFADVQDLYLEQLRRREDGGVDYLYRGEWLPADVIQETILQKGAGPAIEEVIITRHGPIINAIAPDFSGEQPLALRWTAYEADDMFGTLFAMNRARDSVEFREALRGWSVPVQNVVYADRQGNIGYSLPGRIPIRSRGDGRLPVPGWDGEYEWTGYIPFEELPHLYNPPQGYIASANNRVASADYPYFLGLDHAPGGRAQRITEMIEAREKIDVAYIRQMQLDQLSPAARIVVDALSGLTAPDSELHPALELLQGWDGRLAADSPAAAIYEVFVQTLAYRLLSEALGELTPYYLGKGPTPVLAEGSMMGAHAHAWLLNLLNEPASPWCGAGSTVAHQEQLLAALAESVAYLKQSNGARPADWGWGKLHRLTFRHPLGSAGLPRRLFNRGPYPLGGDFDTIWASGSGRRDLSSDLIIGPPFRFIADLSDWNKSLGMLTPGQSGHPGSKYYANNIEAWMKGEYHPLPFDREEVEKQAVGRLTLE